jgi:pimeloyl-ACP methyl ester carboxylesterase
MNEAAILSYRIYGSGYPLILVHGFGEDGDIWSGQVAMLQKNYRVIVPHLRGSGSSWALTPPASIEQMAEDVKNILDREQVAKCIMLGHSMGGYITLAFAEKYASMLDAFGLIHSTAYADSDEKKEARRKSIEFIKQNTAADFIRATIPNLFADQFKLEHPEKVEELIGRGKRFSKEALIAYYECMIARPHRTAVLQQSAVPVLFFIGEEDKAVNPEDAIKQTALPRVCKVAVAGEIAHMGMWEAAEQLNQTISSFAAYVLQIMQAPAEQAV